MHLQTGLLLNQSACCLNRFGCFRGQNKPHIQLVLARIIMRHFGMRIDRLCHLVIPRLRHRHGTKTKCPAHRGGIKKNGPNRVRTPLSRNARIRSKTSSSLIPQLLGQRRKGAWNRRQIILQPVHQLAIQFAQGGAPHVHPNPSLRALHLFGDHRAGLSETPVENSGLCATPPCNSGNATAAAKNPSASLRSRAWIIE